MDEETDAEEEIGASKEHPDYTEDLPVENEEGAHAQEFFGELEKDGKYVASSYTRLENDETVFNIFSIEKDNDKERKEGLCAVTVTPDGKYIIYPDLENYDNPWKEVGEHELESTLDYIAQRKKSGQDPFKS